MTSTNNPAALTGLAVGQVAPDFTLKDQYGKEVSLSDYKGVKNVVVVFYPFAFSSICTGELCEIRDDLGAFESDQVQVLVLDNRGKGGELMGKVVHQQHLDRLFLGEGRNRRIAFARRGIHALHRFSHVVSIHPGGFSFHHAIFR